VPDQSVREVQSGAGFPRPGPAVAGPTVPSRWAVAKETGSPAGRRSCPGAPCRPLPRGLEDYAAYVKEQVAEAKMQVEFLGLAKP
jgi:hypothetical protein